MFRLYSKTVENFVQIANEVVVFANGANVGMEIRTKVKVTDK